MNDAESAGVTAEVVVYGGTAGGVCAAVAAARAGAQVVLLEPGQHLGGMVSGGLGYTDLGDSRVLGGLGREFMLAIAEWYGVPPGHYAGPEPHVAERILTGWLDGVDVIFGSRLTGATVADGIITAVSTTTGDYRAGVYVDASYEGDLMAAAGVPYDVGRESRSKYGESLAGRREFAPGKHQFPPFVSPLTDDGVLPLVHDRPLVEVGAGDGGVMAYGYRVCLTRAADRRPFEQRPGYDPAEWELARRWFAVLRQNGVEPAAGDVIGLVPNLPNAKCDGNSIGPLSLSLLDGTNWAYPDAAPDDRERIRQQHEDYTRDFLWFMTTDPDVPKAVRDGLSEWGLPADEFADTGGIPHQLYVREGRRMLGEYELTQKDLLPRPVTQYDAVAMGSYHIDIREIQRTWSVAYEHPDPVASVFNEGYASVAVAPYQIPYRSIVPRYDDCRNLLVPVCLSASQVAFASVRMEVQYEMLGQAAGIAAAQAVSTGRTVQQVDVRRLQDDLAAAGAVLSL
ncbi:FAD-dependent oxidoreductase [Kribbella swartbergensis]